MTALAAQLLDQEVGTDLGHSRWVVIDQDRIDAFADTTEDHQWIHVDRERASTGPFGTTIAHGYLSLSLVAAFLDELFHPDGAQMMVNYGTERVRFPHPVPVDSELRGHGEITSVSPVAGGFQVTIRMTVEIKGYSKPACVADVLVRVLFE
ncbi:MaoC family dehydratase [Rhodococcus sp. NPDC056960]|uniref:MaoC family dehydratase n=1 Tax=Rhodococcus sp. NPDC056960 TaxID=3345982 RepID=UPI00363C9B5E